MKPDPIIAYREFVDGSVRPIYDDGKRQYVINDDGDHVYGVFFITRDETDLPLIVPPPDHPSAGKGNS
jgi:hypothetical protein